MKKSMINKSNIVNIFLNNYAHTSVLIYLEMTTALIQPTSSDKREAAFIIIFVRTAPECQYSKNK